MQFTAEQIATLLKGKVEGDSTTVVDQLSKIEESTSRSLTFLANPKYEHFIYEIEAGIIVVNEDLALQKPVKSTLVRVKNAYSAFTELLKLYDEMTNDKRGIEEPNAIHETVQLGEDAYVGAFTYIGKHVKIGNKARIYPQVFIGDNVQIGDRVVLLPGVKIYNDCVLGDGVMIHSGAVIGSDGFGFAPQGDGTYQKVPQIGNVVIEDDVEIGANTVVDRATLGSTRIKKGVKLDNLIQIAHNVEIGKNTVIAAQTGVSGSTKVGENVILGGQVGVVGHITIAKGTQVQAQSGINRSLLEENKKWGGSPAFPYNNELRSQVLYAKLPEMERRIAELEKQLKEKNNS
ncbi:UDP-3-O-(3-hydroxymyristoyl)glucosamine N-acyltransferase [Sphingobacterium lactis]|uniref:UDP-3-O-acylglucosamine N-acyltransferase n=1 Tax=Sphingobacterium lactis TaxID=797291 RepID=A0A1H5VC59_9SPHI|nr:UDP-3-O-(3-hydroxymyristoyl)glucosamine N-acyltransferase [Sphingobacterium lactis]SEF84408.1 UDP-3-O-[3-hydroxymyristoyl] glucosamine N-acyltransferase [Sphingobacterium lactis]